MKTINVDYSLLSAATRTITQPGIIVKGQSVVSYNLYEVNESVNNVLFLDINWGDGSSNLDLRKNAFFDYRTQSIYNEVIYGKVGGSVCSAYTHIYNNNTTSYGVLLTSTFIFYYDNGDVTTIHQPVNVYWGSFYDDITELVAINTQIQPISTNKTFVNFESKQDTRMLPCLLDATTKEVQRVFIPTYTIPVYIPPELPDPAVTLSLDNTTITTGTSATLTWTIEDAASVEITPGIGTVSPTDGSIIVAPTQDTTYTITARNSNNKETITTVTLRVVAVPQSTIVLASATIAEGTSTTLTWTTQGAETVVIEPYISEFNIAGGSVSVSPTQDTTYRITTTNAAGLAVVSSVTLSVTPVVKRLTKITQFGITWTFEGENTSGQFVNGDWWVVGPVTITSISPGYEEIDAPEDTRYSINGTMVNPVYNISGDTQTPIQAWDSRIDLKSGCAGSYRHDLNIARQLPYIASPGDSIMSAKSFTGTAQGDEPQLDTIAILTVVSAAPASYSFRPPYISGSDKTVRWNKSQLRYDRLKKLPLVTNTPAFSLLEDRFERAIIVQGPGYTSNYLLPKTHDYPNTGSYISYKVSEAALLLNLNCENDQKEKLLIQMVQRGIDLYGVLSAGGSWQADKDYHIGKKLPVILAGWILTDADIIAKASTQNFQEDSQHYYVGQSDIDLNPQRNILSSAYTSQMIGMPEWSSVRDSTAGSQWNAPYRGINGSSLIGSVLATRFMGAESVWNSPATFDYYDRYWQEVVVKGTALGAGEPGVSSPFVVSMWKAYIPYITLSSSIPAFIQGISTNAGWKTIEVTAGDTSTFTWGISNAATASFVSGIGSVTTVGAAAMPTGSQSVTTAATTIYTVSARNVSGISSTSSITLSAIPASQSTLTLDPPVIYNGVAETSITSITPPTQAGIVTPIGLLTPTGPMTPISPPISVPPVSPGDFVGPTTPTNPYY